MRGAEAVAARVPITNARIKRKQQEQLDQMNEFCQAAHLPKSLKLELRQYFECYHQHQLLARERGVMAVASPALRGKVALHCNAKLIQQVCACTTSVCMHHR